LIWIGLLIAGVAALLLDNTRSSSWLIEVFDAAIFAALFFPLLRLVGIPGAQPF
jgi:hypothetical protein